MIVRFIKTFGSYAPDSIVEFPDIVAQKLITTGVAVLSGTERPVFAEKGVQYTADKVVTKKVVRKTSV